MAETWKKNKHDKHAQKRFKERCNIQYCSKLKKYLVSQIQKEKVFFLKRTSLSRTVWLVKNLDGQQYRIVYSKKTKSIVTILPSNKKQNKNVTENITTILTNKEI